MAFRSVSLYFRISNTKLQTKNLSLHYLNYSNYAIANTNISYPTKRSVGLNKKFQPNRLYHLSEKNYIDISKYLFNNPSERPELRSTKVSPSIPPIEPEKLDEVLSEVKNVPPIKLKDLSPESKTTVTVNEKSDNQKGKPTEGKLTLLQKVKHEIIHYYHGFRLLFLEVKVTSGILINVCKGHTLTRRERKQLVRTVADLARMVPFFVFIIVPFMEFLLPIYVKFFPFMMPSTFKEHSKEAEKKRQLLKGKLEMAKFLQDTLEETRNLNKYTTEATISLESFNQFMKQVRETGQTASTDDIVKFSRLFEDEVTLESLDHPQLKALCKLLELNSIGPKALLGFHLRLRVHQLKVDDKMIAKEGVAKMPGWELQQLCRERGMRAIGVSEERLRYQLSQWLKLSIEKQVPISLLLLSRTMYLPDHLSSEQQLTKTIFNLPQSASKEASLRSARPTDKFDHKTKFELIKEEQNAILEEKQAAKQRVVKETLIDTAPIVSAGESISTSDLNQIESAIESIENAKTALQEEELDELKEQAAELHEALPLTPSGSKHASDKLGKRLRHMINDMDSLLDQLRIQKESIIKRTADGTGIAGQQDEEERLIAIADVMGALKQLKSASGDEAKWQRILDVLDEDHDGQIEVRHVTEVLDVLGNDEVLLTSKEMARLLEVIDKEDAIDKAESATIDRDTKDGLVAKKL